MTCFPYAWPSVTIVLAVESLPVGNRSSRALSPFIGRGFLRTPKRSSYFHVRSYPIDRSIDTRSLSRSIDNQASQGKIRLVENFSRKFRVRSGHCLVATVAWIRVVSTRVTGTPSSVSRKLCESSHWRSLRRSDGRQRFTNPFTSSREDYH